MYHIEVFLTLLLDSGVGYLVFRNKMVCIYLISIDNS